MKNIALICTLILFFVSSYEALAQSKFETYKEFYGKSTTKKCYFSNDSTLVVIIDDGEGNDFEQFFFYDASDANVIIFYTCTKNPNLIRSLFKQSYSTDLKIKIDDKTFIDKKGNMVALKGQEPNLVFTITKRKRLIEMGMSESLLDK